MATGNGGTATIGRLFMLSGDQQGREYALEQRVTALGRGINNDIVIADPQTSRRHLEIVREANSYVAVDAGSANGFYVNDQLVKRIILKNNDVITIGLVRMAFYDAPASASSKANPLPPPAKATVMVDAAEARNNFAAQATESPTTDSIPEAIDLRPRPLTVLGRESGMNDILLDSPQVSRRHCQIINQNGQFSVSDVRSTNSTYLNGARISEVPTPLNDGDVIAVGPYRFMFSQGFLYKAQGDDSVRVDALGISKQLPNQQYVLQNLSFTILPREFVAIVGGSGAGKSTLMDAISGVRPATAGAVLYNRSDYYSQMEAYSSAIGYVPQDDIVPTELTVYRALQYAARLRLPQDTTQPEIQARLDEVMDDLDLTSRRDTPIHQLSGGQRKRVSIGAELISKPSLFFLDEPTSGLDPGLEGRMMQLLRKLADQGRTVVLITHATQNVELCDRVLFLARGGHLAFFGAPAQALEYFGVSRFSDIYIKLDTEKSAEEWAAAFKASPYYSPNVLARLNAVSTQAAQFGVNLNNGANPAAPPAASAGPMVTFRRPKVRTSALRQFFLLTARYFETMISDRKYLAILLLQAPLIALLMVIVFRRSDFDATNGDFVKAKTLIALIVIVAVWFGTSNAAREIVKESPIYRRERRIGLKLGPYIFSKLAVQAGLVVIQVLLLLLIVGVGLGVGGGSPETLFYVYLTLLLTALGGVALGLLISAVTSNSDRATSFVPVALIPQIIFSGALVSLDKLGVIGQFLSQAIVSRWGYYATGTLANLESVTPPRISFNGPPPEQAAAIERLFNGGIKYDAPDWYLIPTRTPEFNVNVIWQWAALGLIILACLVLTFIFQWRKDRHLNR